jgi:hypothetical protein
MIEAHSALLRDDKYADIRLHTALILSGATNCHAQEYWEKCGLTEEATSVGKQMLGGYSCRSSKEVSPPLRRGEDRSLLKRSGATHERLSNKTDLMIAALTHHHHYADDSCLNFEPMGNNDLARKANVSTSTASEFFKKEFKGHNQYVVRCRNSAALITSLKVLNREFSPFHLFGRSPEAKEELEDE